MLLPVLRWREPYLMDANIGQFPVSNLSLRSVDPVCYHHRRGEFLAWIYLHGVGVMLVLKSRAEAGFIQLRLPLLPLLADLIYKAIALGFAFFTLATILRHFGSRSLRR